MNSLSKVQHNELEDKEGSNDDDDEEKVPYSETPVQNKDAISGKYFKELVHLPLTALQNHTRLQSQHLPML